MNTNIRKATKRSVSAIIAVSVIAAMLLALFPAMAGPGPYYATVMGTVTDTNDGEPIENALVVISFHGTEMSRLTDDEGKYKFTKVPECFCLKTIKVTKDGYRSETEDVAVSGVTVVDFELLFMELEPYEGTIMGTVTDNHDGTPMQGVHVELEYHGTVREVYTDSDGKYRFERVPICYCLKKVTATKEHYRPETKEVGVQAVTIVDFALWIEEQVPYDEGTVSGIVTDAETGEPIEGALVVIKHEGSIKETFTDEEGKYTLTGIPMCRCPKNIDVSAKGYISQEGSIAVDEDTIVDFALQPEDDDPVKSPIQLKDPRVFIAFPDDVGVPKPLQAGSLVHSGLVGASPTNLATGLYANFIKL